MNQKLKIIFTVLMFVYVLFKRRPMKSNNQKAVDQVKIFETKPIQQNVLKRDYAMLKDEDTPVLKKKYFHQDSKDEDWDDPTKHKSNASISKNVEIFLNHGNIFSRGIIINLIS